LGGGPFLRAPLLAMLERHAQPVGEEKPR